MKRGLVASLLCLVSSIAVADLKSSTKVTVAGQSFNTTVLMKQGKIRSDANFIPGFSTVTIQDCASQRMIQINDRTHTYMVTELGSANNQESPGAAQDASGTVTLRVSQQDTGERKQMLGYTVRHIRGTIASEGGSGACHGDFRAITDGWYVDLPATQGCTSPGGEMLHNQMRKDGCKDRIIVKASGQENPGYPILLDVTTNEKQGSVTVHQETIELSTSSLDLDPALFEVPAGYSQVQSYEDLAGFKASSMIGVLPGQQPTKSSAPSNAGVASDNSNTGQTSNPTAAKKRAIRIGVVQIASTVENSFSTDGLQQELVNDLNFLGATGVVISTDPHDREAALEQARQQGCDYVVFTTINGFRTASVGERLGSVFNRGGLGGVGGSGQGRVELNAEVKVFQPDGATPLFDGDVNFRQNDADATARGLMQTEARNVMLQIKKLQSPK